MKIGEVYGDPVGLSHVSAFFPWLLSFLGILRSIRSGGPSSNLEHPVSKNFKLISCLTVEITSRSLKKGTGWCDDFVIIFHCQVPVGGFMTSGSHCDTVTDA